MDRAAPQQALNQRLVHAGGKRIPAVPDVLVKLRSMSADPERDEQEGLRARSEQAIGDLAQALFDSQVLENALAAAFGAREKALEAQHAAMSALNLPSAGDVERLERRLRSFSQRLEELEEQIDQVARDVSELRRRLPKTAPKSARG
jgi:septal ring factor EnvC (AmiA/AmiB activator)